MKPIDRLLRIEKEMKEISAAAEKTTDPVLQVWCKNQLRILQKRLADLRVEEEMRRGLDRDSRITS